jgi:hypothetical protein
MRADKIETAAPDEVEQRKLVKQSVAARLLERKTDRPFADEMSRNRRDGWSGSPLI